MSRRTSLSWMGTLAVGLGSLGMLWCADPAHAAPLAATLDGSGAMSQQAWQTAYLMTEGSAEAKVVGPLNRGARLEIDPTKSSEQYWYVKVPDSPGGSWQGYVWKDFVKVGGAGEPTAKAPTPATAAAAAANKVVPMADSLAAKEEPAKKKAKAAAALAQAEKAEKAAEQAEKAEVDALEKLAKIDKVEKPEKPAVVAKVAKAVAADVDEKVVARPRVEIEKSERPKDSAMVAYDPELFEVSDANGVRATTGADPGWDASAASKKLVPPAASPTPAAAVPVAEVTVDRPQVITPVPVPRPAPAPAQHVAEGEVPSPVRQIQALREQIEHELEQMPQGATGTTAANVDVLIVRLNELLKVERSMLTFLESTSKMVEAHDRHIHDLQQRVTTLALKGAGPDRSGISDEVTHLRKRLDELSATVSTTRQHAKRIDALEAQLRKEAPVALEPLGKARIEPEHGSMVVGGAVPVPIRDADMDRRASELESRLTASRKRASALAKSIRTEPETGPAVVDIPHIDSRQTAKALAKKFKSKPPVEEPEEEEREVEDGVVEVVKPASAAVPAPLPVMEAPAAPPPPPDFGHAPSPQIASAPSNGGHELEKGAGLENGTVAAMLKKLRELREQRRREREGSSVVEVTAPGAKDEAKATAKPLSKSLEARASEATEENDSDTAHAGSSQSGGSEPVPDDMREDDPAITPDSSKSTNTSKIKENRQSARRKRRRLADIGNVMSARL